MSSSQTEHADRIASMLELFESISGMTSQQFEDRYQGGDFAGVTWALAWHSVLREPVSQEALAR